MSDAIRTDGLTKEFAYKRGRGRQAERRVLAAVDRLTFSVAEGEIFGLVGPDGAGKSTTMRLLTSIMDPTAGDAWVAGLHTVREAETVKESIGYMSQRFGLYADLTVMENINFYADIYGLPRRGREGIIGRLLGFSNLAPFSGRLAGKLSGGMKQKLGLACSLVHTPKVLFLDEPTNGVDPVSRRDFWRILYQLHREKVTIFISTAYLDEAERCNRLGLIDRGRLLAIGTPDEVKRLMRGSIIEVYSPQARRAVSLLQEKIISQGVAESVGLFGDRIHLVTLKPPAEAIRQTEAVLAKGAIEVSSIRLVEPTLEDVFVSVVSREQREHSSSDPSGGGDN